MSTDSLRVLFVTGALYAIGETRNALGFAQMLREYGDEVFFVSSPLAAELLRGYEFEQVVLGEDKAENRSLFFSWLRKVSPDVVILADYYLFMTDDLQAIFSLDDLASLTVPVLTIDTVGLSPDEQVLSWIPFGASYTIRPLPSFVRAVIRPCPPHDPSIVREHTFYAKVHDRLQLVSAAERKAIRTELGCKDEDRVIFYALPRWAFALAGHRPVLYAYYAFLDKVFARYFRDLDHHVHFVFVSPRRLLDSRAEGVQAHWLKPQPGHRLLSEQRFRSFALAADLFVSDSILSSTLGLTILGLVPSINLRNSIVVEDLPSGPKVVSSFPLTAWARECILQMHRTAPGCVFPFVWFPFGLLEEIERLHEGSAYLEAVEHCELFDEVGTGAAIRDLLFDDVRRAQIGAVQQHYADMVLDLPGFPGLLRQIIQSAGGMAP